MVRDDDSEFKRQLHLRIHLSSGCVQSLWSDGVLAGTGLMCLRLRECLRFTESKKSRDHKCVLARARLNYNDAPCDVVQVRFQTTTTVADRVTLSFASRPFRPSVLRTKNRGFWRKSSSTWSTAQFSPPPAHVHTLTRRLVRSTRFCSALYVSNCDLTLYRTSRIKGFFVFFCFKHSIRQRNVNVDAFWIYVFIIRPTV